MPHPFLKMALLLCPPCCAFSSNDLILIFFPIPQYGPSTDSAQWCLFSILIQSKTPILSLSQFHYILFQCCSLCFCLCGLVDQVLWVCPIGSYMSLTCWLLNLSMFTPSAHFLPIFRFVDTICGQAVDGQSFIQTDKLHIYWRCSIK